MQWLAAQTCPLLADITVTSPMPQMRILAHSTKLQRRVNRRDRVLPAVNNYRISDIDRSLSLLSIEALTGFMT
jgi:hypothetical protein